MNAGVYTVVTLPVTDATELFSTEEHTEITAALAARRQLKSELRASDPEAACKADDEAADAEIHCVMDAIVSSLARSEKDKLRLEKEAKAMEREAARKHREEQKVVKQYGVAAGLSRQLMVHVHKRSLHYVAPTWPPPPVTPI